MIVVVPTTNAVSPFLSLVLVLETAVVPHEMAFLLFISLIFPFVKQVFLDNRNPFAFDSLKLSSGLSCCVSVSVVLAFKVFALVSTFVLLLSIYLVLRLGMRALRKEVEVLPLLKLALPKEMVVLSLVIEDSPIEVVVTPRVMEDLPMVMEVLPLAIEEPPTDRAVFPSEKLVFPMEACRVPGFLSVVCGLESRHAGALQV